MTIMASRRKVTVTEEDSSSDQNNVPIDEEMVDGSSDDQSDASIKGELVNSSSDEEIAYENQDNEALANEGWADSIAKILKTNKPKGKKTLVLSKAKKLTNVRKIQTKDVGFEVQAQDGEIKQEQVVTEVDDEDNIKEPLRKKRKELISIRTKPNILDKDRERTLSKIATRGVVQLFNAVKNQQKDIDNKLKEAGPLEVKRDKVLKNMDKREFLNVLMGDKSKHIEKSNQTEKEIQPVTSKKSEEPTWNILRNDFMMGAKMKDWDKELETESEVEKEIESE
ncbi:hypothetical protein ILUMI_04753 [Ignelater luminosus]|uniref:RRP15-like protein n=1 Tax=Ignelater luminosus TaxID=2038154 RepID=A0A8K0DBW8_IGNLU|nr:hypothetical protein ILUMI_04753 [Ignelater luminosus]